MDPENNSEVEQTEQDIESAPNPRDAMLEALGQRRNEGVNAELEESGSEERIDITEISDDTEEDEETSSSESEAEDAVVSEAEEGVDSLEEESAPETPARPTSTVTVTLGDGQVVEVPASAVKGRAKVDGEELEVDFESATRNFQKDAAVQQRLRTAAERAKELDAREAALALKESQLPAQGDVKPALSDEDVRSEAEKIASDLYSGDVNQATEAIAKLLARNVKQENGDSPQPISADDVVSEVERKLEERKAGRSFQEQFPEIVSDRSLMAKADAYAEEILIEHPDWSKMDVFNEAGTRTRKWIKDLAGVKDEPPTESVTPKKETVSSMEQRREQKARAATKVPTSKKVAGLGAPPKPQPTNSDIIAEMKKSRGQSL